MTSHMRDDLIYDYIIIGSGSAGAVLAGRLTENGRHRVLLLEAGPSDLRFFIQMPIGYGRTFYDPAVNWMYRTEPVPGLDGRVVYWPRGKVLGGSSSINAMVYSRGQPADFDDWEAMGNKGWGWKHVLALYKRMEDHALGGDAFHGTHGPLHVSDIAKAAHPLSHIYVKAGIEAGLRYNRDLNGESIEGVGLYQLTTKDGFRMSAARAYLWRAKRRPNLTIETGALATRILFEGKRAIGVEYRQGGKTIEAHAGREIILSGGAINSPQLLQLSGIGPPDVLKRNGIEVQPAALSAVFEPHRQGEHESRFGARGRQLGHRGAARPETVMRGPRAHRRATFRRHRLAHERRAAGQQVVQDRAQ